MQEHDHNDPHDHHDAHTSIANWKGPVIATAISLVATVGILVLLTQIVTDQPKPAKDDDAAVLARLKPVGELQIAAASGPKGQLAGEQVFNQTCKTCHEAGLAGAPKVGDKKAWGKVIAQGLATSVDHAIKGIRAMPPKGGNPDYENAEIERAVVYMANQAGANWKAAPPAAAAQGAERSGEEVVKLACAKCHATGERGAPKIGDAAAWRSRAARGLDTVTQAALKGHGGMPARAGMADLSDAEVKRAIEYMLNSGTQAAAPTAAAPAATASAASAAPAAAAKPDGKKVYDTTCMACHATGAAGAPKFADKAAWAPRIKTGIDALHASALKGKGAMPPKGGNTALSDADVTAAVDYMVAAGK
ncbi:MAG TPA: c-type cytochrome [Casimicrobiaceae bacterium]|nr:c-type cytochrome [Casimicrobiaceae bacterium]